VYFIKLIFFAIIIEFLSCFGIDTEPDKLTQNQISSDSLSVIVPDTIFVYQPKFEEVEDLKLLKE